MEAFRQDMLAYLRRVDDEIPDDTTVEQGIRIASRLAREQVEQDIVCGIVPASVRSFSELHEYVDANCYGGAFSWPCLPSDRDSHYQDLHLRFWNQVQQNADEWLRAGRPRLTPNTRRLP